MISSVKLTPLLPDEQASRGRVAWSVRRTHSWQLRRPRIGRLSSATLDACTYFESSRFALWARTSSRIAIAEMPVLTTGSPCAPWWSPTSA